jgi:hypothetical protein
MSFRISNSNVVIRGTFAFNKLPIIQSAIGTIYRIAGVNTESGSFTYTDISNQLQTTQDLNTGSAPLYIVALSGSLGSVIDTTTVNFFSGQTTLAINNTFITASETGSSFIEELITGSGAGTWTKPTGITQVVVECWGAGGAGGGVTLADSAGGGGAGGQYARKFITYVTASQNISYTIGTGGTGGTGVGGTGNDTTWNTNEVVAKGGEGGQPNGISPTSRALGGIASTVGGVGDIVYKGFDGGDGLFTTSPNQASSGVGGIGPGSTGDFGTIDITTLGIEYGGSGGQEIVLASGGSNGNPGNLYGAGGSGAAKISGPNRSGGNGALGLIRLLYRSSYIPEVQNFIYTAGITGSIEQSAINNLVISAKANGWWDKCIAIYPFVGGIADTHKYNLKDPRDLDAAFRLAFFNSPIHNANGVTWDGTNTYADTFILPTTDLVTNSVHASVYSRTNVQEQSYEYGAVTSATQRISTHLRFTDGNYYGDIYSATTGRNTVANADSTGHYIDSRTASNSHISYKNGSQIVSNTTNVAASIPTCTIFIGNARDCSTGNPASALYSSKNIAFFTMGTGLSGTDASNMYTDIQAFQTTLGRQV